MAVIFGTAILYIACKFSPPSGFLCGKAFAAETCWKLPVSSPILECLLPNAALSNTRLLSIVPLIDTVGRAALSKCIVAGISSHHLVHLTCELGMPICLQVRLMGILGTVGSPYPAIIESVIHLAKLANLNLASSAFSLQEVEPSKRRS